MLPFLVSFLIPLSAALGLARGGWWTFSALALVFVITPLLDLLLGVNTANPAERPGPPPSRHPWWDLPLWLWVPVQLGLIAWGIWRVAFTPLLPHELVGVILSVGLSSGAGGITVAHELMHRRGGLERSLAEVLMASTGYTHFCIEHVRGHHRHVATPEDPASARPGEGLWAFLPRTLAGGLRSAFTIETERVRQKGLRPWDPRDRRLRHPLTLLLLLAGIGTVAGWKGSAFFVAQGGVAFLLLEVINYVEHYGLERRRLANGRYERVGPAHSWNAPHRLTNWYLFNLQRHTDHHLVAARPYWTLRHVPDSPQLPAGYATMVLLALVPPLWRRVMDRRAAPWRERPEPLAADP